MLEKKKILTTQILKPTYVGTVQATLAATTASTTIDIQHGTHLGKPVVCFIAENYFFFINKGPTCLMYIWIISQISQEQSSYLASFLLDSIVMKLTHIYPYHYTNDIHISLSLQKELTYILYLMEVKKLVLYLYFLL